MSTAQSTLPPRSYHHGNLRQTLIDIAVDMVERSGHEAVSLRDMAVTAGVSRAAPYRHFPDRAAVLAAVACEGYRELLAQHARATAGSAPPRDKLRRVMQSFLDFSVRRPGMFHLMYDHRLPDDALDPELAQLEQTAFNAMLMSLSAVLPQCDPESLRLRMMTLWATLYGHASARQRHQTRPYMRPALSDAQIDAAVIDAAIGPLADGGISGAPVTPAPS